ncbi:MAG: hypothetical protein AAGE59_33120 [Cyanobacteria bacterium P01_F01_bin.86]
MPPREGKDNLYTHLFRAVYGTIASFWFCPPSVPELEFRAAIQGHYKVLEEGRTELRRSLAAARHYFDYEIADAVIATHGGKRKGVRLYEPGVKVLGEFQGEDIVEKGRVRKMGLKRVLISEEDKERVIEWQDQFAIASQDQAMGFVVGAAEKALAIAEMLDCDLEEVVGGVEEVLGRVTEGKAKLAEAERAISLIERGGGNQSLVEQSLAMANEFNGYLKQENEQLKQERGKLLGELENLRSQLGQFESMKQQFMQFQQLFSGAAAAPVANPGPAKAPEPVAIPGVAQNGAADTATATRPRQSDGRSSPDAEREINLIIDEIIQFNEQQAQDDDERWQINQSVMKQLCSRSQSIIKRVLESRADIQRHHDQYGMYGRRWNVGKDIEVLKSAIGLA